MTKKDQIIELLEKYSNETDMFKAFITQDEFSNLADDLVKLFDMPDVRLSVCECSHGFKKKGYDECAICGGKWTGRKL